MNEPVQDRSADRFLRRFFRLQERAASTKCVSAEAATRGTFEEAKGSETWRLWSIGVMGRVETVVGPQAVEVARHYYLGISNAHFSVVARSGGQVTARELGQQETPDQAADLQSFCDWRRVALDVLKVASRSAQVACQKALMDVRAEVRLELDRRAEEEEEEDEVDE